jgi:hypothetical protein
VEGAFRLSILVSSFREMGGTEIDAHVNALRVLLRRRGDKRGQGERVNGE